MLNSRLCGFRVLPLVISVFAASISGAAFSQDGSAGDLAPVAIPGETAEEKLAAIDELVGLSETERESAARALREAIAQRQRAESARERAAGFAADTATAPQTLAAVREELSTPAAEVRISPEPGATLAQLEQGLAQASADARAARETLQGLEREVNSRKDRRTQIPGEISAITSRLQSLQDEAVNGSGIVGEANALQRSATVAALEAELESLRAELASYDARQELLPARRDRAVRRVARAEQIENQWQALVQTARSQEAARSAMEAERLRRDAASQSPVLSEFAMVSSTLAKERASADGTPQKIAGVEQDIVTTQRRLAEMRRQYQEALRKLNASGLNRATGLLLRKQFESLPELSDLKRRLSQTREALEEAEYTLVDRQEMRSGAGDIDAVVSELVEAAGGSDAVADEFREAARELAIARRDLLNQLISDATTLFDRLLNLEEAESALLSATGQYDEFIGERILWVRSITRPRLGEQGAYGYGLEKTLDPSWIGPVLAAVGQWIRIRPFESVTFLFAILASFGSWWWSRLALKRIAQKARAFRTDKFSLTVRALVLSVVSAAPVPLLWWVTGYLFQSAGSTSVAAFEIGYAFEWTLWLVASVVAWWVLVAPDGLADAHFRWSTKAIAALRRQIWWTAPIFVPLLMVVIAIDHSDDQLLNASVGRVAFTLSQLVAAWLAFRVLRPRGAILSDYYARHPDSPLTRAAGLIVLLGVLIPLVLTVLSWVGYHYTALRLAEQLAHSLGLVLALIVGNSILMRSLFIARRNVALEDARRRREQAMEEASQKATVEDGPTESSLPPLDEDKLDLPAVSEQTTQLFRVTLIVTLALGFLGIWADVLPALRAFDRVQIWPEWRVVESDVDPQIEVLESGLSSSTEETATSPSAPATTEDAAPESSGSSMGLPPGLLPSTGQAASDGEAEPTKAVSLADVGAAILIVVIAFFAFRNVPGLLEIFLLQRLPLDAASRFAIATVLRYAIVFAGIVAASASVGIAWEKIQWLAAALTFGLAFGLQEIFANFVSGLIILAERPVRIGDTVTVNNVSGVVSKIRMRATTVTDWDRKELVIPNKSFIMGEVINWTLSDPRLRVIVPVGVAYGSNVELVEKTLRAIADANTSVLKDPKPYVYFRSFGDSTLNFELRAFIPHIDQLIVVQHQIHVAIDREFRKAGIEIAFPQRDLHLRTAEPLMTLAQRFAGEHALPIARDTATDQEAK